MRSVLHDVVANSETNVACGVDYSVFVGAKRDVLKRLIDDPAVKIVPITTNLRPVGTPSRLGTEMYHALEHAGAMAQLRAKGIASYGVGPASTEGDTVNYGAHSDVERLPETSLYGLVEFTWRATMEVAARK